jgi:hypothetical protein
MPDPFVAQLGRISGPLLADNLVRDGINLSFRNKSSDADLLLLEVTDLKIGIKTDIPAFTLDINSDAQSDNTIVSDQATFTNIVFQLGSTVTSVLGAINVLPASPNPTVIFDRFGTADLSLNPLIYFDGNSIQSYNNANIIFNAHGTGTIELQTDTEIIENNLTTPALSVNGNVGIRGNLFTAKNITIGDSPLDIVVIQTGLIQDLNPGVGFSPNIGAINKRWSQAYINDWSTIETIRPFSAFVGTNMFIGGLSNQLKALIPNDDFLLSPDTGITTIEQFRFEESTITNLNNTTPITLSATGNGYFRFAGSNGVVIPSGTNSERPLTPELGDTRWNTEIGYLECFDGNIWVVSTGGGEVIDTTDMQDLSYIYTLMLG